MPARIFRIKSKPLITKCGNTTSTAAKKGKVLRKRRAKKKLVSTGIGYNARLAALVMFLVNFHVTYEFAVCLVCGSTALHIMYLFISRERNTRTGPVNNNNQKERKKYFRAAGPQFHPKLFCLHTNSSAHSYEFLFFFCSMAFSSFVLVECVLTLSVYFINVFFLCPMQRQTKRTKIS